MGRGVYCLVDAPLGRRLGRPQRETFEWERGELPAGRSIRSWGPLPDDGWARGRLSDCTLCTDFTRAHSLLTLASSPVRRFLHRRYGPAAQREKNPAPTTHSAPHSSRSGRPSGKLLNGNVGSSLAGRSNRNWGP